MIEPLTRDLEVAVRSLVVKGSSLHRRDVIPANDGSPAPSGLYATVLIISRPVMGIPENRRSHSSAPGEIDVTTVGSIRARYSVQWFRGGAVDAARRFSIWVSSPKGLEAAADKDITVLSVGEVRRLDEVFASEFEERAALDFEVGYVERLSQKVKSLAGAEISVSTEAHTERLEIENGVAVG